MDGWIKCFLLILLVLLCDDNANSCIRMYQHIDLLLLCVTTNYFLYGVEASALARKVSMHRISLLTLLRFVFAPPGMSFLSTAAS